MRAHQWNIGDDAVRGQMMLGAHVLEAEDFIRQLRHEILRDNDIEGAEAEAVEALGKCLVADAWGGKIAERQCGTWCVLERMLHDEQCAEGRAKAVTGDCDASPNSPVMGRRAGRAKAAVAGDHVRDLGAQSAGGAQCVRRDGSAMAGHLDDFEGVVQTGEAVAHGAAVKVLEWTTGYRLYIGDHLRNVARAANGKHET